MKKFLHITAFTAGLILLLFCAGIVAVQSPAVQTRMANAVVKKLQKNMDGRITNQYIVRRRSDGRWLVLPWDYDKTFLADKSRDHRFSNPLYDRCRRCIPGFRERLVARWAALRAGPLSDEALERWIDERSAFLAPFMDEDFRLVPPADFHGAYPDAVGALRREVLFRARRLDAEPVPAP